MLVLVLVLDRLFRRVVRWLDQPRLHRQHPSSIGFVMPVSPLHLVPLHLALLESRNCSTKFSSPDAPGLPGVRFTFFATARPPSDPRMPPACPGRGFTLARSVTIPRASRGHSTRRACCLARSVTIPRTSRGHSILNAAIRSPDAHGLPGVRVHVLCSFGCRPGKCTRSPNPFDIRCLYLSAIKGKKIGGRKMGE